MKCSGIDVSTGDHIELDFDTVIQTVDHPVGVEAPGVFVAPAWIDLQVNGYAAVDYNDPKVSHTEIARSVHVLHSTGTARFFPTVITGSPEDMLGSLKNLTQAKHSLPEGEAMEGFHVEGPHIAPDDGHRGAHPERSGRRSGIDECKREPAETRS